MSRWKIALLLIPACLWGRLVFDSLWLDESLVYWSIKDGFSDALSRVLHYQNQSPFYNLVLWATKQLVGSSEAALRLLSLLAAIGACFAVSALASRLLGPEAGLFAAFYFAVSDDVIAAATNVRNYSFAILFTTLSMLFLLRWVERLGWKDLAGYGLSTVLATYSHFFFVAAVPLQLLFVLYSARRSAGVRAALPGFVAALYAAAAALMPNLFQLELLGARAQILSFAPRPGFLELVLALFPPHVLLFTAAGLLAAGIAGARRIEFFPAGADRLVCFALWWALPPLLFFAASRITGSSVFVSRYFSWSTPALALLIAYLTVSLPTERARVYFASGFALVLLVGETSKYRGSEDWRGAIRAANELLSESPGPVLAATGLIEAQDLSWLRDPVRREYILAPFSYYPLAEPPLPLPSECASEEAKEYFHSVVLPRLFGASRVLTLTRVTSIGNVYSPTYYAGCMERFGWEIKERREFDRVALTVFTPTADVRDRPEGK